MNKNINQIALVTGASRGIGKAVAIALSKTKTYVFINYKNNKNAALNTLKIIQKNGDQGEILGFDVSKKEETEKNIKNIIKNNGKIDILVNNAGLKDDMLMVRMKQENWESVINTNLTGFYNVSRLIVKNMIKNRFGRIINITSTSGQTGAAGQVNYSASKAGLIGATKALAKEIASRNITVNAVAPGFIETEMTKNILMDEIVKSIPVKRFGTPKEVAAAVMFLCSKQASYITGQVLGVNGGIF
ncbi:MAG: 3-oxoacyl-ACP reductase [Desulfobacteraceae bacterium 4572_130]|nr:MAG: 3-oxoacyl-ACP reductase [Desulfobacteraceae bacterium 4572_130]